MNYYPKYRTEDCPKRVIGDVCKRNGDIPTKGIIRLDFGKAPKIVIRRSLILCDLWDLRADDISPLRKKWFKIPIHDNLHECEDIRVGSPMLIEAIADQLPATDKDFPQVSIIMPCLNEADTLAACIGKVSNC